MTYNASIPQGSDFLSTSQGQILDNFGQLNTQFAIDHTAFNTGSGNGNGFHKKVTLPDQTGSIPSSAADQVVVYGKTDSSISAPYYKRDGLATVFPLSPIKAFAMLTGAGSSVDPTINRSYNIASVTCSVSVFTVTLSEPMNTTGTDAYGVIANRFTGSSIITVTIVSPTVFTLSASGLSNLTNRSCFIVLE